jgi:Insertion element 4 transposase N-terminal/Transposase DDE domain
VCCYALWLVTDDQGSGSLADAVSIGLLARVFPADVVDAAVDRAGVREKLNRQLPARLMVYFLLACWLWSDRGYVRVLRELVAGLRWARGGYEGWRLPYDGSVSKARVRLGDAVMADLFAGVRGPAGQTGDAGVFYQGLRVCAWDGTVFDLERTAENLAEFAVPAGGWFPQLRLVALVECGTLAVLDAAHGSIGIGERELAARMLGSLDEHVLLLADRGFPSFELCREVAATGARFAMRVSAGFALDPTARLTDGTYLTELRGRRKAERMTVRVVEFSAKDADTGISEVFALVTTLLDHERYPAGQIARLYLRRWRAETLIEILKIEIRGTHATFRSKAPAMVRQELYALLCCYQAIRQVIDQAARQAGLDPARISFPPALDAVRESVARAISPLDPPDGVPLPGR